jgi:hypothetical protein
MTELFLATNSYTNITREATEPKWDRDDTSTDWTFGPIYLQHRGSCESFETDFDVKAGDVVYAVVAVWSTGDSFGHDDASNSEVFGSFQTYEEADKFKTELENIKDHDGSYNFTFEIGGRKIYVPWIGYFESLDYIEIVSGVVT